MQTMVVMRRELFGCDVSQRSDNEFFSATDLYKAGNRWRMLNGMQPVDMASYFNLASTKEYIEELEAKHGKCRTVARGRGSHTWVHPLVFIDMALSISPKLKLEAYEWLFDNLIKFRNESGDSYKKMCGALFSRASNQREFPKEITELANTIKVVCEVSDWQQATQEQLKKRDRIHEDIALLADVMNNNKQAIRLVLRRHGLNIEV